MSYLPLYRIDHVLEAFARINPMVRVGQIRVLLYVAQFRGASPKDVAERTLLTKSSTDRALKEWVELGYLEYAGGKETAYYLTPVGQSFINSLTGDLP